MRLNNLRILHQRRKELRKRLTPAEASLWNHLKNSQLEGMKFRRQHSVGRYILDFYCVAAKLAIELDGAVHNSAEAKLRDKERDAFLLSLEIKVLRFENKRVFDDLDAVLAEIRAQL
ncbi:MAG TPA: DUF559 domain-containing protein [Turneriella sp.]|nr:DUF559 domain-containing protein [Turneriella sp.]